jgi:hypothetical protein
VKGHFHARFLGGCGRADRPHLPGAHSHHAMNTLVTGTTIIAAAILLAGCGQAPQPTATFQISAQALTNATPTLSRSEVMEKFRSRATPAELQEFERLSAAGDLSSESRAMELVLFKLTDKELFQIGITEVGQPDRLEWGLAWCRGFTDSGRSFEQTLASVGVSAGGVYGHGYSGWYVPREQFFAARRALLAATNLHGIEFTITEPKFGLR